MSNLLKKINNLIFDCSVNLEYAELEKQKIENLIDDIFNNKSLDVNYKIELLKDAWLLYKQYDEFILPNSLNNLKQSTELLNK